MKTKIEQALERLEEELVCDLCLMKTCKGLELTCKQENNKEAGGEAPTEEVTKAKEAVAKAKAAIREAS